MNDRPSFSLFSAFGVELEYMVVDAASLDVLPVTDRVLHAVTGAYVSDVERGPVSWSNELALHVIELKTTAPAADFAPLPGLFQDSVHEINRLLAPLGGRLMPSAMHPWMDPYRQMRLWPHDNSPIYETFNRIFDCRGHGWANLQSVHLNLPFADDAEFGRLHAAIRLVLPLLPALAASSPVMDGRVTGLLDNRLDVYRHNARRIPSVSGQVIPEAVFSRAAYERQILQPLYRDIAAHDPDGVLQYEWLNARGAIARFDRHTIEIRVLDVQECPAADVGICAAATAVLRALAAGRWTDLAAQQAAATEPLAALLQATTRDGERAVIDDRAYLDHFGYPGGRRCQAGELWQHLIEAVGPPAGTAGAAVDVILRRGPLARRILDALAGGDSADRLSAVYRRLCTCLAEGASFLGV